MGEIDEPLIVAEDTVGSEFQALKERHNTMP